MGDKTKIQWSDSTWNPIKAKLPDGKLGFHCEKISPACTNCYAESYNRRNLPNCGTGLPYARSSRDQVEIALDQKHICDPIRWTRPRRIFVCSMTDLFGEFVSDEQIDQVFSVMAASKRHTFQLLTKRPHRAAEYLDTPLRLESIYDHWYSVTDSTPAAQDWPLPNIWVGSTTENQEWYDRRMPDLIRCNAAVRFVSCEPLLGPINMAPPYWRGSNVNQNDWLHDLGWVICGGESGHKARPMEYGWASNLMRQCRDREDMGRPWPLPFFMKQGSAANWDRFKEFESFPEDLQVREFPVEPQR